MVYHVRIINLVYNIFIIPRIIKVSLHIVLNQTDKKMLQRKWLALSSNTMTMALPVSLKNGFGVMYYVFRG